MANNESKRIALIRRITDSPDADVEDIWRMAIAKKKKGRYLTERDIVDAFSSVAKEMVEDSVLYGALLAVVCNAVVNELFDDKKGA